MQGSHTMLQKPRTVYVRGFVRNRDKKAPFITG